MASRKRIEAGEAYVGLGVRSRLKAGLKKASARLRAFGSVASRVGAGVSATGGLIASGFVPAILKASEFNERFSKFQTVFGANSKAVKSWADGFASDVGRAKSDVVDFLASSQDLLVPMGVDPKTAEETSKQLTKLGVDLASFNNKADADVMRDLQAAITGSGEVMKKYGVILSESAVKQELLNTGIEPKNATNAQKAMARMNIILAGTKAAQGDAIRTSGSFANQMKALRASFNDFLVAAGAPLLDMLANVAGYFTAAIKVVSGFVEKNAGLVKGVALVAVGVGVAGLAIAGLAAAALVASTVFGALSGAGAAAVAVFAAITSPIGLTILAIAGVAAAVSGAVAAFLTLTDTGRSVVAYFTGAFSAVLTNVSSTFAGVRDALQSGDLGLAAKIGFTGVKIAIADTLSEIERLFGVSFEKMFQALAEFGKAVAVTIAKINVARQQATNAIASVIGSVALGDEGQRALEDINRQKLRDAEGIVASVEGFDAQKFGSDIREGLNGDKLREELAALKREAEALAKVKEDVADIPAPAIGEVEPVEPKPAVEPAVDLGSVGAAIGEQFKTVASLSASAIGRQGPGARGIEDKILRENEKQTGRLDDIVEELRAERTIPLPNFA